MTTISFTFDDIGAVGIETIIGTALRPRRGGPRFVDPDEAARAQELQDDPRTNDQLAYDLIGKEDFVLDRPGLPPTALPTRVARRYDFGDLRPAPRRLFPAG